MVCNPHVTLGVYSAHLLWQRRQKKFHKQKGSRRAQGSPMWAKPPVQTPPSCFPQQGSGVDATEQGLAGGCPAPGPPTTTLQDANSSRLLLGAGRQSGNLYAGATPFTPGMVIRNRPPWCGDASSPAAQSGPLRQAGAGEMVTSGERQGLGALGGACPAAGRGADAPSSTLGRSPTALLGERLRCSSA